MTVNCSLCTTSKPMTTLTRPLRGVHALSLHALRICSTVVIVSHFTFYGSSSERIHKSSPFHPWRTLFDSTSPFLLPLPPVCHRLPLPPRAVPWAPLHDRHANLRCSAAEESEDTLKEITYKLWAQPPDFGELNDSSVPFSLMIPSTDQDVMTWHSARCSLRHTEDKSTAAYQEACQSVSQSSSVMFDGSGQPDGERMVDQSGKSDVTFNVISAHSNFPEDIQTEKWSIDWGNLMSVTARTHRLGLYFLSRDRQLWRKISKISVITNSMQFTQKKSADSYKDNYGDRNWNFVKLSSSTKSHRNGGITKISEFYLRYDRETKAHRGSEHYFGINSQSTGTAKWSKLYERF